MKKEQPNNIEAEKTALGSALVDSYAVNLIIEKLDVDSFYSPRHALIFEAIQYINARDGEVNIISVTEQLDRMGKLQKVGGSLYVTDLALNVVSSTLAVSAVAAIKEKRALRRIIEVSEKAIKSADEGAESPEIIDMIETDLLRTLMNIRGDYKKVIEILPMVMEDIDNSHKPGKSGVSSGFTSIDRATGKFRGGELILIAARPSDGKTAFAIEMCRRNAKNNIPSGFVSLEMRDRELIARMLSMEAKIDGMKIRRGDLDKNDMIKITSAVGGLSNYPVYVDHSGAQSMTELKAKAKRLKLNHDVQFLCVDYLQLINASSKYFNRNIEIGMITSGLKALAKELDIPIILLSQLNRDIEMNAKFHYNKLSDLRDSGCIEADADVVYFLIRPERFSDAVNTVKLNGKEISSKNLIIAHQAKHRAGKRDEKIPLSFLPETTEFQELDIYQPEPEPEWYNQF